MTRPSIYVPGASAIPAIRDEIKEALADERDWRIRKRLVAIDAVLAGETFEAAGAIAQVTPRSISRWLAILQSGGLAGLRRDGKRAQKPTRPIGNPGELRRRAVDQTNWRVARRLRAVASFLEGQSITDIATQERISEGSMRNWLAWFEAGGTVRLIGQPPRGGTIRLKPEQLDWLKNYVSAEDAVTSSQACEIVQRTFNVKYGVAGMRRLLRSLGFRCARAVVYGCASQQ